MTQPRKFSGRALKTHAPVAENEDDDDGKREQQQHCRDRSNRFHADTYETFASHGQRNKCQKLAHGCADALRIGIKRQPPQLVLKYDVLFKKKGLRAFSFLFLLLAPLGDSKPSAKHGLPYLWTLTLFFPAAAAAFADSAAR